LKKLAAALFRPTDWLGLPRRWATYLTLLMMQAVAVMGGLRLIHIEISRIGILLHLLLLAAVVVVIYLAARQYERWRPRDRWIAPLSIGLLQFFLLIIYLVTVAGYLHLGAPFTLEMMVGYWDQLPAMIQAVGMSPTWVFLGVGVLLAICLGMSALVFARREEVRLPTVRLWSLLGGLCLAYAVTRSFWLPRELLHVMVYRGNFNNAPPSILAGQAPLKPRYSYPAKGPISPRPLVLITVDALRADAMQAYGNATTNTPFLSGLLASGRLQRLDNAHSICTYSFCGLLGTIASRYWEQLDRTPDNLADVLHEHGYESHFMLSGDHTRYFNLRQQYGENLDSYRDGSTQSVAYMNDDRMVLGWLDGIKSAAVERSFLFIHLMSVHRLGMHSLPAPARVADPAVRDERVIKGMKLGQYIQHYHDGVIQADDTIRRIFSWLDTHGWLDDALIIITADHAERLGERGGLGHGGRPYWPVTNIPLLVYDPRLPRYPPRPVYSQVDVAPTFLRGIDARLPDAWSGIPLQEATTRCAVRIGSFDSKGWVGVIEGQWLRLVEGRDKPQFRYLASESEEGKGVAMKVDPARFSELRDRLSACASIRN